MSHPGSFSVAHKSGMNHIGARLYPDGKVPWEDSRPPEKSGGSRIGRLRACAYCGSMHPTDVAEAILKGARGEWADRKYGWPHKAYFDGVPNPNAGLLEVRGSCNFKPGYPDWVEDASKPGSWHEPPRPAPALTNGKFYSVHLLDASETERSIIEAHLGTIFVFEEGGTKVSWSDRVAG